MRAGADAGHLDDDALGLEPEAQHVGLRVAAHATGQVRHRPEVHRHLHPVPPERLAGPEPEHGAAPAPEQRVPGDDLALLGPMKERTHA